MANKELFSKYLERATLKLASGTEITTTRGTIEHLEKQEAKKHSDVFLKLIGSYDGPTPQPCVVRKEARREEVITAYEKQDLSNPWFFVKGSNFTRIN